MENWLPLPVMMNDNEELLLLFIDKVQTIYIICCEKVIIFKIIWPIKKTMVILLHALHTFILYLNKIFIFLHYTYCIIYLNDNKIKNR